MKDKIFLASYTIVDYGSKIKFLVPSNKVLIQVAFSILWLILWNIFGTQIINPDNIKHLNSEFIYTFSPGFVIFIFILFQISPIYTLLWQLTGQEIIIISNESIIISRKILGMGFTNKYLSNKIVDVHVDEIKENPLIIKIKGVDNPEKGCKSVVFYYDAKRIKIVSSIVEEEAWQILQTIQKRFPQYESREIIQMMSRR